MKEINFLEVNAQSINSNMINTFEAAIDETLYPGDERRIFLDQETQIIVGLKNDINESAKQNLLRYAKGALLDAIGERTDTIRMQPQKAVATIRFTLSLARSINTIIPKGTRVTPDGKLYFLTKSDIIISAGQLYGDAIVEAAEGGTQFNNFAPGQIKSLVDPTPYISEVINIDTSSGGKDIEPDDDGINIWSGYRERIRQAPSKFSTAGPEDAYIYWAKSADVNIADVKVVSPSPGVVKIVVLMKNGELPMQSTLDAVFLACNEKKRRPLTDNVVVSAPIVKNYNINLTYYIDKERVSDEVAIREAVESAEGAIDKYKAWQGTKLGRDINPDYLRQLILNAGAYRIDLASPSFSSVGDDEIAKINSAAINYGGLI